MNLAEYNPVSYMETEEGFLAIPRSPKFRKVRGIWILNHPFCEACGGSDELELHHKKPFEYWPELELDESNFVTLCMKESTKCHLIWGHLMNFKLYNPNIDNVLKLLKDRKKFSERNDGFFDEYILTSK